MGPGEKWEVAEFTFMPSSFFIAITSIQCKSQEDAAQTAKQHREDDSRDKDAHEVRLWRGLRFCNLARRSFGCHIR